MLTQNCPVGLRRAITRISRIAGLALAAAMSALPMGAQVHAGIPRQTMENETGVDVSVADVQGTACNGAIVELASPGTQTSITGTTNIQGRIHFSQLAPGTYAVVIHLAGFESYKRSLVISGRKVSAVNVTLMVAPTQGEVVSVVASPITTIQSPPVLLDPVAVPSNPQTPPARGLFHRSWARIWHPLHGSSN